MAVRIVRSFLLAVVLSGLGSLFACSSDSGSAGGSGSDLCADICNCMCDGDSGCMGVCPSECAKASQACQQCVKNQPCSSLNGIQGPPAACSNECN